MVDAKHLKMKMEKIPAVRMVGTGRFASRCHPFCVAVPMYDMPGRLGMVFVTQPLTYFLVPLLFSRVFFFPSAVLKEPLDRGFLVSVKMPAGINVCLRLRRSGWGAFICFSLHV